MGNCSSSNSIQVATAKLILEDGKLQEFTYPVKASYVLQNHPTCFICNADELDFDVVLSGINNERELQLGQLYFALPLSKLGYTLKPDEMAALAMKASAAFMKSGYGRLQNVVFPVTFSGEEVVPVAATRRGSRRRDSREFKTMLSTIPE